MNLRNYYQRVHEVAQSILTDDAWVVSEPTADGGRGGVLTEVPKVVAARMIIDGRARLATEQEAELQRQAMLAPRGPEAVKRIQVTLAPAVDGEKGRKER